MKFDLNLYLQIQIKIPMSVTNQEILESIQSLTNKIENIDSSINFKIDNVESRIYSKLENIDSRLKIIENNFTDQNKDIIEKINKITSVNV